MYYIRMGKSKAPEKETCYTCGLPSHSVFSPGFKVLIEIKPESRFQKLVKKTVWCHSKNCAYQALGTSKYGTASFRWPMTFAQFKKTVKKLVEWSK